MPESEANPIVDRLDGIVALLKQLVAKDRRPSRVLRLAEAARYLHVSPGKLRCIIGRGDIPIIRDDENVHAPWLIDIRDLDEWVEHSKITLQ